MTQVKQPELLCSVSWEMQNYLWIAYAVAIRQAKQIVSNKRQLSERFRLQARHWAELFTMAVYNVFRESLPFSLDCQMITCSAMPGWKSNFLEFTEHWQPLQMWTVSCACSPDAQVFYLRVELPVSSCEWRCAELQITLRHSDAQSRL